MRTSVLRWWPAVFTLALAAPASAQNVWQAYQFRDTEQFRYDLTQTVDTTVTTGTYRLSISPAGGWPNATGHQGPARRHAVFRQRDS